MMRMLMAAVESTLCHLEVENVVIPSSEGVEKMWINNFYYSQEIDRTLEKHIVLSNMLMFPYAIRLQKALLPNVNTLHLQESNNSKRVPVLLDLNYEPPQEDEDM
ncbi:uncharacterized protein LOC133833944 [Humulus lupulus]|uniref:uncharacterized protein LOC133833944 n=1 Tax=Humulus lupulus TaxID=3486 RepID=UPI002B415281|nr:uncharacterized protein LOC133833944 [Humulus lupulus]